MSILEPGTCHKNSQRGFYSMMWNSSHIYAVSEAHRDRIRERVSMRRLRRVISGTWVRTGFLEAVQSLFVFVQQIRSPTSIPRHTLSLEYCAIIPQTARSRICCERARMQRPRIHPLWEDEWSSIGFRANRTSFFVRSTTHPQRPQAYVSLILAAPGLNLLNVLVSSFCSCFSCTIHPRLYPDSSEYRPGGTSRWLYRGSGSHPCAHNSAMKSLSF